jgi:formate/nitrite transporter
MYALAILAGMFIAFGGVAATTVAVSIPYASLGKLLGACVFPGGLAMVILMQTELFTGNNLLVIPLLQKNITLSELLRNWIIVYFGNLVGSTLVAGLVVGSHQASLFGNAVAESMVSTAAYKVSLSFGDALLKGIACNVLVCIAVWIGGSVAKTVSEKIIGIFFPIMIFVLCGFEHSVANMYYLLVGMFAKYEYAIDAPTLTWVGCLKNLCIVTLGNMIGGIALGCILWYTHIKED